jgi:hemerythrin-like domain-containing protein
MCDHCGCRAFPPIAELTAEHDDILSRAWDLAEAARTGAQPSSVDLGRLLSLLDVHVVKEETGLYPLLVAGSGLSDEQRAELEDEHRTLRLALVDGAFDRRAYYALAAHIEAEEMELFPAAMFGFDDEEWDGVVGAHRAADAGAVTAAR